MKIVADANIPAVESHFAQAGNLRLIPGREITAETVRDADLLLVRSITKVNAALLSGSQVKFVGSVTAGQDHIDTEWLQQQGIRFAFASGFNAPPVADYVASVVAALQQQQRLSQHFKAAVIGVGCVGRLVKQHLQSIGATVSLCDPFRIEQETGFVAMPLAEIANMDFITLHVPLTKTGQHPTYHLIDPLFLARQNPGCIVVNTSRGEVIATATLLHANPELTWCLDVFENEPQINQQVLTTAFIATPHIAGYSMQSKQRGVEMIYQAACQGGWITPIASANLPLPRQTLSCHGCHQHWQEVVLSVFNPLQMTQKMRAMLMNADDVAARFDQLRNQFQGRHEFAFTEVNDLVCEDEDRRILERLGIQPL